MQRKGHLRPKTDEAQWGLNALVVSCGFSQLLSHILAAVKNNTLSIN